MLYCWFLVSLFNVVLTVLEIILCLDVFFEVIKDLILPQLKPEHVNIWIVRIGFFYGPPRSIITKSGLDEGAIVAFAHIKDVIWKFLSSYDSEIVRQCD